MADMRCTKCHGKISRSEKYAITLFFVRNLPSSPYYAHIKCPARFAISE
jgi:hypothetical protein